MRLAKAHSPHHNDQTRTAVPAGEQWITFYRIWQPALRRWLLVQKRDGSTRTVVERFPVDHAP
ncbi:MAG: hypothetical protein AB1679_22630 [Actinomycetota bacterium]|jgi:hypothetical protein